MFLPISCTSPFTVASNTLPFDLISVFSASINGFKCATACFITRADLTTCGKNISPAPNKSPTTFIPSINGPSITSSGRVAIKRAASVSSTINSLMPFTNECSNRLLTGSSRHVKSALLLALPP